MWTFILPSKIFRGGDTYPPAILEMRFVGQMSSGFIDPRCKMPPAVLHGPVSISRRGLRDAFIVSSFFARETRPRALATSDRLLSGFAQGKGAIAIACLPTVRICGRRV